MRSHHSLQQFLYATLSIYLLITRVAQAQGTESVTLGWNPPLYNEDNTPCTDLCGYKVHYGGSSRGYVATTDVGHQTTARISALEAGQTYYFAVTAYDTNQNESAYSEELVYTPEHINQSPVLVVPPDQSNQEGASVRLTVQVSDPDPGDTLTFQSSGLPDGLALDPHTGVISGVLSFASAGSHTVSVSVSDGSAAASGSFAWYVTDINRRPLLAPLADQSHIEGQAVELPLAASDPDGDPLTFQVVGLPDGLAIDPTRGVLSGVLSTTSAGFHVVNVTVSDGSDADSKSFDWNVAEMQGSESVTLGWQPPLYNEDNTPCTDLCGYKVYLGTSSRNYGPPIDVGHQATAEIGGLASEQTYYFAVTAYDANQNESAYSDELVITPERVNHAPVLDILSDQTDPEGATVGLTIRATDPDGDSLVFEASGLPDDLTLDPHTGIISGVLSHFSAGSHTVAVTASDGSSADAASFVWNITEVNRPPVLGPLAGQSHTEGQSVELALAATDPDGDSLAFQISGLPDGLAFDPYTGIIAGVLSDGSASSYPVTVTVSDGSAADSGSFIWNVIRVNQPPTGQLTSPAEGSEWVQGDTVALYADASDPDGVVVEVEFYVNGAWLASDTSVPYEASWRPTQTGTYELAARIIDDEAAFATTPTCAVSVVPATDAYDVFVQEVGGAGIVSIEAEHYHVYGPAGGSSWSLITSGDFSGKAAMQSNRMDPALNDSYFAEAQSRLDFRVRFAQAGPHYVWIRGKARGNSDGTLYYGLDGHEASGEPRFAGLRSNSDWHNGDWRGSPAMVIVPSVGIHTVSIWAREDRVAVDKVLLTASGAYHPIGEGPGESPTQLESTGAPAPSQSTAVAPAHTSLAIDSSTGQVQLAFPRRQVDADSVYVTEESADGVIWVENQQATQTMRRVDLGGGIEQCVCDINPQTDDAASRFYRIRVVR